MRYFFNQLNGEAKLDDEGLELGHIDDARAEAVRYAGELMRDHPTIVWTGQDFRIEVTNSDRLLLFTVIVLAVDAPPSTSVH